MDRTTAEQLLVSHGYDPRYHDETSRHGFLERCKMGPLELVEAFLVCGMPVRALSDHTPPIIKAAESGRFDHIQMIVAHGGSLETVDLRGDTALHTAANHGHIDLVRALHGLGCTLETVNAKKWTPLTWALHKKNSAMVKALLALGADPDFGVQRPLAHAGDELPLLEMLLAGGAKPDLALSPWGDTLLLAFTRLQKEAIVELLLRHGAKDLPNRAGWTASMVAKDPATESYAIASMLAKRGLDGAAGDTRLHVACSDGSLERAQALVREGVAINAVNASGRTPLFAACATKHCNPELVRWLLDAGADPAVPSLVGEAAITHLAGRGDITLLELLLARGAPANEGVLGDPDAPASSQALIWAANAGHLDAVKLLVEAGARLDSRDSFEQTAVFLAASKGRADVLAYLLSRGANPSVGGRAGTSPLLIATSSARVACVKLLVEAGVDLEQRDTLQKTALMIACDQWRNKRPEHSEIVTILLEAGADPSCGNSYGATPLKIARSAEYLPGIAAIDTFLTARFLARHTQDDTIDWSRAAAAATTESLRAFVLHGDVASLAALIDHGLDVRTWTTGPSPVLFDALRLESPELATLLLDRGADPWCARSGNTTLLLAAGAGHTELVKRLLALGHDPNLIVGDYKDCALNRAARSGHTDAAAALLAAGANPNPFRGGISPLIAAALAKSAPTTALLLAHGADPNIVTNRKQTALEVAREKGANDVVELLAKVTTPDVRDAQGRTSLFRACMKGDVSVIDMLLAIGADATAADQNGDTPRGVGALRENVAARLGIAHAPLPYRPLDAAADPFVGLRRRTDRSADPTARNRRGDSALHIAVLLGDLALASDLIERGADVHARNAVGDTPWSLAIHVASEIEPVLRARGAKIDIDAQIATGNRRDRFATVMRDGDLREVNRQLDDGLVEPHVTSAHGSPLMSAVLHQDLAVLELLLAKGCDPLVVLSGPSLLVAAAAKGDAEIVRAVLRAGVPHDPGALQLAAYYGRSAAMHALLDAGIAPSIDVAAIDSLQSVRVLIDVALERGLRELVSAATTRLGFATN